MVEEDESPHVNMDETNEEAQDTCPAFDDDLDSEVDDFTMDEDDRVFMVMVHPVDPHHFVCASSTVSGHLVEHLPRTQSQRVLRILCRRRYMHMLTSLVKQPLTLGETQ
jgi:hypothetical protein